MLAPHKAIRPRDSRQRLLLAVLDQLWARYRARVAYARAYEAMLSRRGGVFLNDHVAFRTLACQSPAVGLFTIGRLFESLGYAPAGAYHFPDKRLNAVHYAHDNPAFPKLFVSELRLWELSPAAQACAAPSLRRHRPWPGEAFLRLLRDPSPARIPALARQTCRLLARPWPAPQRRDVERLDAESQFGAWVLLHGYEVNHFTASIGAQGVPALAGIEATVAALRAAGVPMKPQVEGAPGARLRQSATEAVVDEVSVRDGRRAARLRWTYAYFELAERPRLADPVTGRLVRFEGFLGPQAAQLFDMTGRKAASPAGAPPARVER